jgi:pimeloyl-ACP methyl ester carboxylesterase
MPVLAIGGEKANGELLGQQMKIVASDVTVVVLKDTGHWVLEEKPKETTDALMKFLSDFGRRGRRGSGDGRTE